MNNEQSHKVNLSDAEIDALYMLVKNEAKLAEAPANIKFWNKLTGKLRTASWVQA